MSSLLVSDLGLVDYDEALVVQRGLARARIAGALAEDLLLLCEHPPVVTLGRSSSESHLVVPREALAERGVLIREIDRGGDVTFHGPGQLVGYGIIDLRRHTQDLHWYLRQVEAALMRALETFGIETERSAGQTGVWTHGRKIASIGVHAREWVTWHGFALNVTTDLSYFDLIVPCGIAGVTMTSMRHELGRGIVEPGAVRRAVADAFAETFGLMRVPGPDRAALDALAATHTPASPSASASAPPHG